MRNVVIAPTSGLVRDPAQQLLPDGVKDPIDAIRIQRKVGQIIPPSAKKGPDGVKTKEYHNLRVIHAGNDYANKTNDEFFSRDEMFERHPQAFVSLPVMDATNNRHIKGMNNT